MSVWPRINRTAGVHLTNEENELDAENSFEVQNQHLNAVKWVATLTGEPSPVIFKLDQGREQRIQSIELIASTYAAEFNLGTTDKLPELLYMVAEVLKTCNTIFDVCSANVELQLKMEEEGLAPNLNEDPIPLSRIIRHFRLKNFVSDPKRVQYAHQWATALTDDELPYFYWGAEGESQYIKNMKTIAKIYADFFSCSVTKMLPEVVKFIVTESMTNSNFSVSSANETIQESIKRLFKTSAYRPIVPVATILGFNVVRNIASTQRKHRTAAQWMQEVFRRTNKSPRYSWGPHAEMEYKKNLELLALVYTGLHSSSFMRVMPEVIKMVEEGTNWDFFKNCLVNEAVPNMPCHFSCSCACHHQEK